MGHKSKIEFSGNTLIVLTILLILVIFLYSYYSPFESSLRDRPVGPDYAFIGVVTEVDKQKYSVKIELTEHSPPSPETVGKPVYTIYFSGIGSVNTWKSYGLEEGYYVRLKAHWAENSYWESFDDTLEILNTVPPP